MIREEVFPAWIMSFLTLRIIARAEKSCSKLIPKQEEDHGKAEADSKKTGNNKKNKTALKNLSDKKLLCCLLLFAFRNKPQSLKQQIKMYDFCNNLN